MHANFRPVGLDHFGHAFGVRVIGSLHRHRPQIDGNWPRNARFRQQRFGLLRIVVIILQLAIRAPYARRQQVFSRRTGTVEYRFNDRRFIDRHGQGLTHLNVVQRRFLGVKRQETGVKARFAHQVDRVVLFTKNETIDMRLPLPVFRERREKNSGIFLILREPERTGTNRVHIHTLWCTGF